MSSNVQNVHKEPTTFDEVMEEIHRTQDETKKPKTIEDSFKETLDEDGVDWSLFTGLQMQRIVQYGLLRNKLSKIYPKPEQEREASDDTLDVTRVRGHPDASLFSKLLDSAHEAFENSRMLQTFASEYEKKIVRWYSSATFNWRIVPNWSKNLKDQDLFEMVESYFNILRKYGLNTEEEPYYFLSPERKRKIKFVGEMLKRSTNFDESAIKVSILEALF